jgi:glycosyltransferase involved in cell wall biosynthesis
MQQPDIIVSVITITYNHESFITQTIDGILKQKTTFRIEYIIADDCSTDNTCGIINNYVVKYPELIRFISSKNNIGAVDNEQRALEAAKGKYIAICEGDDYWTEPLKLQKQIEFLENHPEYSICFHRCIHYNTKSNKWEEDNCKKFFREGQVEGIEITTEMFFRQWITQPLTMVFRRESFNPRIQEKYKYYRDIHQIYHLLQVGKGYLFPFIGGVRNIHPEGMAGMSSLDVQCSSTLGISRELYRVNHSGDTKKYYEDIMQWCIYEYCSRLNNKKKAWPLTFELFLLNRSIKRLGANLKRLWS